MLLRFRFEKQTKVRFFSSEQSLRKELDRRHGLLVRDAGAPWKGGLPLPAGEKGKNWEELGRILGWLGDQRAERSQPLVVLGGGAALDLGALAASLYRRGTPLILVPTTLLAMVDATLGGKTAVDGAKGQKNFAGTFYPAEEVWIYPGFLSSLPKRERISGAGECWKTLWLSGKKTSPAALTSFVEKGKVSPALSSLIKLCLATKKKVVESDPLDTKRIRESLNYGHTVGHALEALSGGRISHGEAVLWGMAVESGGFAMQEKIGEAIRSLDLSLPEEFSLPPERWEAFLQADKKWKGGKLEMTVLSAPGKLRRLRLGPAELLEKIRAFRESCRL